MCLAGCTVSDNSGAPPTPPATTKTCSTGLCGEGGTERYSDDKVEVRTGVTVKNGSTAILGDAISITVKCNKNPHVLQFIYREIIGADGKPKKLTLKTSGGEYETTTDPAHPVWNTDSAAKPSPYYEPRGTSRTDPGSLTTFDQPSLLPGPGETWRATFKAFTICDGKVVKEVTWVRSQKSGESPTYSVDVKDASALPDWANKQLKDQGYNSAP